MILATGSPGTVTRKTYAHPWLDVCSSTELESFTDKHRSPPPLFLHILATSLSCCLTVCNKIKKKLLQCLLQFCKPSFLKAPGILQKEMKILSKEYNSRITFDRSVKSYVLWSHSRKKKHTLLIAQTVFSRVDPLLVLMIFDKSSRAARRWANVIVDFGDNA